MKKNYSNIFSFCEKIIRKTVNSLRLGKIVGLPTETVYGLAGNAYSLKSLKKIYKLKKRPKKNPLIIHYYNLKMAKNDVILNDNFIKLYKNFCPGPITFVLKKNKKSKIKSLANTNLDTVAIRFPNHRVIKSILKVYEVYQKKMKDLNAFDFGDLILFCVKLFENHNDIREIYQNNFKYILVDEFQDTNFIQNKWLNLLVNKKQNICCVGDDDQSIYSWRGAEIKNFLTFDQIYKDCKVYKLEQNYRSTKNILETASNLISTASRSVGHKPALSSASKNKFSFLMCACLPLRRCRSRFLYSTAYTHFPILNGPDIIS